MNNFLSTSNDYSNRLQSLLSDMQWQDLEKLGFTLLNCWKNNQQIFICGNGGSAANAIHIANDLVYGAGGLRAEALSANTAILTCLANDINYEEIYAQQIKIKASAGDLLIVLSGSGNSKNITRAITIAKQMRIKTAGIIGYDGGKAKSLLDIIVHTPIDDMQIAEDMQLITTHMLMQWLNKQTNKQTNKQN